MKKLIVLLLAISAMCPLAAQTPAQTPDAVIKRYAADYPNVKAVWTMSGPNYRAEYTDKNGMSHAVIYDMKGDVVGNENQLKEGEYPSTISTYYVSTYPHEAYKVWSSEDKSGNRVYYIHRGSDMVWFDKSGMFSRTSTESTY